MTMAPKILFIIMLFVALSACGSDDFACVNGFKYKTAPSSTQDPAIYNDDGSMTACEPVRY